MQTTFGRGKGVYRDCGIGSLDTYLTRTSTTVAIYVYVCGDVTTTRKMDDILCESLSISVYGSHTLATSTQCPPGWMQIIAVVIALIILVLNWTCSLCVALGTVPYLAARRTSQGRNTAAETLRWAKRFVGKYWNTAVEVNIVVRRQHG